MSVKLKVFGAEWCGPCQAYHETINKVAIQFPDIEVENIDVDEQEELADQYGVKVTPTTLFVDGNSEEVLEVVEGLICESILVEKLTGFIQD